MLHATAVHGPTYGLIQSAVNYFAEELQTAQLDLVKWYFTVGPGQNQVTPSWPRSWANFSISHMYRTGIPTGMHGPTCIFGASLTPFSLQLLGDDEQNGGVRLQMLCPLPCAFNHHQRPLPRYSAGRSSLKPTRESSRRLSPAWED